MLTVVKRDGRKVEFDKEKIQQAVKDNKKILVFGDYDVDGVSATAIMLKTLKKMGLYYESQSENRKRHCKNTIH